MLGGVACLQQGELLCLQSKFGRNVHVFSTLADSRETGVYTAGDARRRVGERDAEDGRKRKRIGLALPSESG